MVYNGECRSRSWRSRGESPGLKGLMWCRKHVSNESVFSDVASDLTTAREKLALFSKIFSQPV